MKQVNRVIRIAAALAAIYGLSTAALWQSPERFGAIMSRLPNFTMSVLPFEPLWMRARSGGLNVGDQAPDFLLSRLGGAGKVQLSAELREHPVVLVFGSYT
jgi:hypothetical protein